jgi:hypothetical protein
MLTVPTDQLLINTPADEAHLLSATPHLIAIAPRFVDHSAEPANHTLYFIPSPDTLEYTNDTLHRAHLPKGLLAPLPPPTYLQASSSSAQPASAPQPQTDTILKTIFTQWDHATAPAPAAQPSPKPSRKRSKSTKPTPSERPPDNRYAIPKKSGDSDSNSSASDSIYDPNQDSGEESHNLLDDDESKTSSTNLSHMSEDSAAIKEFLFPHDMSQATCAQFRQLQFFVESNHPDRIKEYFSLLRHSIAKNKDPASFEETITGWSSPSL